MTLEQSYYAQLSRGACAGCHEERWLYQQIAYDQLSHSAGGPALCSTCLCGPSPDTEASVTSESGPRRRSSTICATPEEQREHRRTHHLSYISERRERRRQAGVCIDCGENADGFARCEGCRRLNAERRRTG